MAAVTSVVTPVPDDDLWARYLNTAMLDDSSTADCADGLFYVGDGAPCSRTVSGSISTVYAPSTARTTNAAPRASPWQWAGSSRGDYIATDPPTVYMADLAEQSLSRTYPRSPESDGVMVTPSSSQDLDHHAGPRPADGEHDLNNTSSPMSTSSYVFIHGGQSHSAESSHIVEHTARLNLNQRYHPYVPDPGAFNAQPASQSAFITPLALNSSSETISWNFAPDEVLPDYCQSEPSIADSSQFSEDMRTSYYDIGHEHTAPPQALARTRTTLGSHDAMIAFRDNTDVTQMLRGEHYGTLQMFPQHEHHFDRYHTQQELARNSLRGSLSDGGSSQEAYQYDHFSNVAPMEGSPFREYQPSDTYSLPQFQQPVAVPIVPTSADLGGGLTTTRDRLRISSQHNQAIALEGTHDHRHVHQNTRRQGPERPTRGVRRPLPSLAKAPRSETGASHAQQRGHTVRGGRKGTLSEEKRKKSHAMRKAGGCWRCAFQRDPCPDTNEPCHRCHVAAEKGQLTFFDCNRSKLPDFVHDFLPPSMTVMHQKQTIEDTVKEQVVQWDTNAIEIYLTSGYGPAQRWKVHEFLPRSKDLMGQFQYLQDPTTGQLRPTHKYSPPLGLLKLDASDDYNIETHLETLLSPEWLEDFGWTCYEEESQVDSKYFQARLLDQICRLFLNTGNTELRELLQGVIRMMVITYIMGHTLTISEDTLPDVLSRIRLSERQPPRQHTSPRLANRQIKFYFAVLRTNIYQSILNWQQQTLKSSKRTGETWLTSFCAMLGFAMVLEEIQRTIIIQADAKIRKEEMTQEQAMTEARNACQRIDERYKLLVGLFQCKYRNKAWGSNGSFGQGTPRYSDHAAHTFLGNVRALLEDNKEHLVFRKEKTFSLANQCQYTSRLVAHFLLPFLELPKT